MGDDRPEPRRIGRTTGSSVLTPPTGLPVVPVDAGSLVERRRAGSPVPPADTDTDTGSGSCLCGHGTRAHEHWRPGSDCGVCGAAGCPTFRRHGGRVRGWLRRSGLLG